VNGCILPFSTQTLKNGKHVSNGSVGTPEDGSASSSSPSTSQVLPPPPPYESIMAKERHVKQVEVPSPAESIFSSRDDIEITISGARPRVGKHPSSSIVIIGRGPAVPFSSLLLLYIDGEK